MKYIVSFIIFLFNATSIMAQTDNITRKQSEAKISTQSNSSQIGRTNNSNNRNVHCGHAYVDLGLPSKTKWATCNIGANNPEQKGRYYAWGETMSKLNYTWDNYNDLLKKSTSPIDPMRNIWHRKENFKKYSYTSSSFVRSLDDVATQSWGDGWQTPSLDDWIELKNNCSSQWITINGISGLKYTGRNGNYIFLPVTGAKRENETTADDYGLYWTCEIDMDDYDTSEIADYWQISKEGSGYGSAARYIGLVIRPVYK